MTPTVATVNAAGLVTAVGPGNLYYYLYHHRWLRRDQDIITGFDSSRCHLCNGCLSVVHRRTDTYATAGVVVLGGGAGTWSSSNVT